MSRKVRLGTVSMILNNKLSGMEYYNNMVESAEQILTEAANEKPDLMVLPEYFAHAQLNYEMKRKMAERIPDSDAPLQAKMSELARKLNSNLVYGAVEVDGDKYYNVAVVLDRKGGYVGKYRKVHLYPGERAFFTPGDEFPVMDLDIGKLGVALCMDIHYPEMWTIMALNGADIVAHPAGWMDYTGNLCESLVNARAVDNQYYVITSHFVQVPYLSGKHPGHSRIVDPYGRTRADTSHLPGYAIATVDLDQLYEYWAKGDLKLEMPTLKECFLGMKRPELYGQICEKDEEKKWKLKNPIIYEKE
jgi:predicted amidohydrolase